MENSESNRNEKKTLSSQQVIIKEKQNTTHLPKKRGSKKRITPQNEKISIYPDNNYSHPIQIAENQSDNNVVVNQQIPNESSSKFPLDPIRIICPFCFNEVETIVKEDFNCCTCCIFLLIISLCALPCLFFSGLCNSFNCFYFNCDCRCCNDGTHTCPNCKKVIGFHSSEPSFC